MEWKELCLMLPEILQSKVCYAAKEDAKIRFDFGEGTKRRQGPAIVELPATQANGLLSAFRMKS